MFHGFGIAAPQKESYIRKSGDWFLFVLQQHRNNRRNMINSLFSLLFKLAKLEEA